MTRRGVLPLALVALAALASACGGGGEAPRPPPPNLLILVADDVGTDRLGLYGSGAQPSRTPNLDRLGREGLVFERFWAMPTCSPTRASLVTGQLPTRTGIGSVIDWVPKYARAADPVESVGLDESTDSLAQALAQAGYASAIVGKWHVATRSQGLDHPLRMGFGHHRGSFGNLTQPFGVANYSFWLKSVDGVEELSKKYATTDTTDEAIALASELPEPWLLVVSYNAPHGPAHLPPAALHSYANLKDPDTQKPVAYRAMLEALDTEIGRLLEHLAPYDPFTFFLGDNGTPGWAYARSKQGSRAKGSLYEGGVRVPFLVRHSSIVSPGRRVAALASVTDLFATAVEISGAQAAGPPDSVSLAPLFRSPEPAPVREWVLAESFWPNGPGPRRRLTRAARDARFKLIRSPPPGRSEFFDLASDPAERRPLRLAALKGERAAAYRRLARLVEELPPVPPVAIAPEPAS